MPDELVYLAIKICLAISPTDCKDVHAHIPGLNEISCAYQAQNFAAQHIMENYPHYHVASWGCVRPHSKA